MDDSFGPSLDRKSTRLAGFDYAQDGAYFITIVTQGRACLFGNIVEGEMRFNAAGEMVARVCGEMPHIIPAMAWGIYQIMPNHFHAIIELHTVGVTLRGYPAQKAHAGQTRRSAPTDSRITLGDVVGRFKSLTTCRYIEGVHAGHWPRFTTRLWQRNYYEHIIRDEKNYQSIFDYVLCNPQNWEKDREYPVT
jgi:REP element-mobilizing transposase RayT